MEVHKFNYLLKALKEDKSAFTILYNYYFPRIVLHINSRYKGKVLGEDIGQEFFIKLGSLNIEKIIDNPTAWVYKVCDNLVKDKLKKEILAQVSHFTLLLESN